MLYPKMENRKSAFIYPPFSVSNLRTFHLAYPCFKCLILKHFRLGPFDAGQEVCAFLGQ